MDPGDLLMFDMIAREGGISAASRKLQLPKATISRRLQRLEATVGAPLFDRAQRRLRLTAMGEALVGPSAALRIALASAQANVDASRLGDKGCLRVTSPFLFGRLVLADYFGRYIEANRGVTASLYFSNDRIDPLREAIDVAIQTSEPTELYLVRSKLAAIDLHLYATPDVAGAIKRPQDVRHHPFVVTSNKHHAQVDMDLTDGHRKVQERVAVLATVNDPEAASSIIAGGSGIAALPDFLARKHVHAGTLKPVLRNYRAGQVTLFAVTPPGRANVPVVRKFIVGLKQYLAKVRFAD